MKHLGPILCFVMAAGAAYVGATAKNFYGGGVGRLATKNPTPTWFGRLWFFGFAAVMLYLGVKGLR